MRTSTYHSSFRISLAQTGILKVLVAIALLGLVSTPAVHAQKAWGYVCTVLGSGGPPLSSGNLYSFNLNTGNPTFLGAVNCGASQQIFAGEFVGGVFYALDNNSKSLVTIASDGTCTSIGSLTGIAINHTVSGLSQDLTTGTTYAMSTDGTSSTLYTINLSTGALSTVGTFTGVGISLMIDDLGNAYVIEISNDRIHPINLATGAVGPGVVITEGGNPVNLNFAQDADFDCGANGQVRGVLYSGGGNGRYGTLNPTTGVFAPTLYLGAEVCAFSIDCGAPVPTMGEWALLILALSLMSMGTVFILRKRLVLAGETAAHYRQPATFPFHKATFAKALVLVLATMVTLFAVATWSFGYEMTSADLPGALIASPIAAYLLHLLVGFEE